MAPLLPCGGHMFSLMWPNGSFSLKKTFLISRFHCKEGCVLLHVSKIKEVVFFQSCYILSYIKQKIVWIMNILGDNLCTSVFIFHIRKNNWKIFMNPNCFWSVCNILWYMLFDLYFDFMFCENPFTDNLGCDVNVQDSNANRHLPMECH